MKTTIHTPKNTYKDYDTYLQEKETLFKNLTKQSIQKELLSNDIDIQEEDVCKQYQKTYQIDDVVQYYDEKYDQQLDVLGNKNEVFDDDAFIYLIKKIIEEHYDIHQVPDKTYLVSDIQTILSSQMSYLQLLQETNSILERLIHLKDYEKNNHLGVIFNSYMIDIDGFITRVFQDIKSIQPDQDFIVSLLDLMIQLNQAYQLSFRYSEIVSDLYDCLVKSQSLELSNKYLGELKKQFPKKTFNFYYVLLSQLKKENHPALKQYYQEALQYKPYNDEQADLMQLIKEIYENIL